MSWGSGQGPHRENETKCICTPLCKVLPIHPIVGHFQLSERVLPQLFSSYTEEQELTEAVRRIQHHTHTHTHTHAHTHARTHTHRANPSTSPLQPSPSRALLEERENARRMLWTPASAECPSPAFSFSQAGSCPAPVPYLLCLAQRLP